MPNNVEVKNLVDERDKYKLCVVKIPDTTVDVYGIIHKEFDVLEMSTSVLPNARKMLDALNDWEQGKEVQPNHELPEIFN